MRPLWPGFPIPQNPKYFSNLDIIALGGRQEALYGSNYSIICINYDLISVLVSKGKHADLEYEIICRGFQKLLKILVFLDNISCVIESVGCFARLIDQDHVFDSW